MLNNKKSLSKTATTLQVQVIDKQQPEQKQSVRQFPNGKFNNWTPKPPVNNNNNFNRFRRPFNRSNSRSNQNSQFSQNPQFHHTVRIVSVLVTLLVSAEAGNLNFLPKIILDGHGTRTQTRMDNAESSQLTIPT